VNESRNLTLSIFVGDSLPRVRSLAGIVVGFSDYLSEVSLWPGGNAGLFEAEGSQRGSGRPESSDIEWFHCASQAVRSP